MSIMAFSLATLFADYRGIYSNRYSETSASRILAGGVGYHYPRRQARTAVRASKNFFSSRLINSSLPDRFRHAPVFQSVGIVPVSGSSDSVLCD
jgi:hypothetical protein